MNNYIDVVGESSYWEVPTKVVLDIELFIRAAKEETAVAETREYVSRLIDELLETGLEEAELRYGGRETYLPWWKRDKAGIEIRNKVTILSARREIAYKATDAISRYPSNKRVSITIDERQPIFEPKDQAVKKALEDAFSHAREKALHLAKCANSHLGEVMAIQEWKRSARASGSYGDGDWWGDSESISYETGAMMMAAAPAAMRADSEAFEEPGARLVGNERKISIKLKVRFALSTE